MTGKNLVIISQFVLWYENSFRIDCKIMHFPPNLALACIRLCPCFV